MMKTAREICIIIRNIYKVTVLTLKSSKRSALALIVLNVLVGILIPLNLIIWKYVLNSATESLQGEPIQKIIIWLGVLALNTAFINLLHRICSYLEQIQAKYINRYITNLILDKIERLDMAYFEVPTNYDKAEKANNNSINNAIQILNTLVATLKALSILISSIIVLILLDYKVVIVGVISILPVFLIDLKNYAKEYEIYCSRVSKLRHLGYLKHILLLHENIKEIKIFRANSFFKDSILSKTDHYIKEDKKFKKYMIARVTVADALQNILSYLNKVYIIFVVISRKLTIGDLTLYIETVNNLEYAVRSMLGAISSIYNDNLYIDDLFNFLAEKECARELRKKTFPKNFEEIRFENVWFKYPGAEEYTLKDINLTIKRNKTYAFVGENGSGKTTLIKLFMGLYDPTRGHICVDGIDFREIDQESLFMHIGVIFQDFIKYPLNIKENIGIGKVEEIDDMDKIIRASECANIHDYIQQLPDGYHTQLQKQWDKGIDLSIGQWQKIAISRALMADSQITILDEPTASLDPKSEYELFKTLKEIMIRKTCLFITHRFSNVHLAHEIVVIQDGEIIEKDSHANLLSKQGVYAQLYYLQAEAYLGA